MKELQVIMEFMTCCSDAGDVHCSTAKAGLPTEASAPLYICCHGDQRGDRAPEAATIQFLWKMTILLTIVMKPSRKLANEVLYEIVNQKTSPQFHAVGSYLHAESVFGAFQASWWPQ